MRPPFRADQVGSLLRPEALKQARERFLGPQTPTSNLGPHNDARSPEVGLQPASHRRDVLAPPGHPDDARAYKGGGAGIADVVSGQIEMLITGVVTAAGRIKSGQVRPIVSTGSARTPLMLEVPTMAEAGVSDFALGALFGIFVPAQTPGSVVEAARWRQLATMAGVKDE